jgi:hypothetical protein
MSYAVFKEVLKLDVFNQVQEVSMRAGKIICAREQFDEPCIWYICEPESPMRTRKFILAMTGRTLPNAGAIYVGTVLLNGGAFVLHIFEVVN